MKLLGKIANPVWVIAFVKRVKLKKEKKNSGFLVQECCLLLRIELVYVYILKNAVLDVYFILYSRNYRDYVPLF